MMQASVSLAQPHLQAGTIRAPAVANRQGSELFPGIPTIAASGSPGFEVPTGVGVGLFASAQTPPALVERINAHLRRVVPEPGTAAWLRNTGITPEQRTSQHYEAWLKTEVTQIETLLRKLNLKPE